jgi:hypothetical protein
MVDENVLYSKGEVLHAISKREAIQKWINNRDEEYEVSGVIIKDSYTFREGEKFSEETYYLVAGVNIGE